MIKALFYHGISTISKMICKETRSPISHVCAELEDGRVVEAWHEGVNLYDSYKTNHTKGTLVEVFEINGLSKEKSNEIEKYLLEQCGSKYDFKAVAAFLFKNNVDIDNRLFCSESVATACKKANIMLLERIEPQYLSPRDIYISPMLKKIEDRAV